MTTAKRVVGLQSFEEYVFNHHKACRSLLRVGECVLTTIKRIGSLQRFGEYVFATAKSVERL